MEMDEYYWLGGVILEKGSVVLPGNWARLVMNMPGHHLALREQIYESIRIKCTPDLPSRLNSNFICLGFDSIRQFRDQNSRGLDVLYKVELLDTTCPTVTLDSELLGVNDQANGNQLLTANQLEEKARKYWGSSNTTQILIPEVLTTSPIRIVERLS